MSRSVRVLVAAAEPLEMPEHSGRWYVTFGSQYRHTRHPSFPVAHPDGYLVVQGQGVVLDEEAARQAVQDLCGYRWSSIYGSLAALDPWLYPLGRLATLTVHDGRAVLAFNRDEYRLPPGEVA